MGEPAAFRLLLNRWSQTAPLSGFRYIGYRPAAQLAAAYQGVPMAQRTVTTLVDDIDGSEGRQTVTFGLDGATYEIDLNDAHAEDLREVLAPFVSVARTPSGPTSRGRSTASAPRQRSNKAEIDPKAVRAWAEANGVAVSSRGRIKADVLEQYRTHCIWNPH